MEETREVDNDEIVDSIMAVTLQQGLTVEKIVFEQGVVNIYIEGAKRLVSFRHSDAVGWSLKQLNKEIGKYND